MKAKRILKSWMEDIEIWKNLMKVDRTLHIWKNPKKLKVSYKICTDLMKFENILWKLKGPYENWRETTKWRWSEKVEKILKIESTFRKLRGPHQSWKDLIKVKRSFWKLKEPYRNYTDLIRFEKILKSWNDLERPNKSLKFEKTWNSWKES